MENRKNFLTKVLRKHLSKVLVDPKVKSTLSPQEAQNGIEMVIERIVERAIEREAELDRRLAFPEFRELMMETLDELHPRKTYIV